MSDMHQVNIARLEVASIQALDALLRERSVSKAAQRNGLSQPAMSHMLARLRKAFDDPLLVRGRTGFLLTANAERLLEHLSRLIPQLEAFGRAGSFVPQDSRDTFRIACTDHAAVVLLPILQPRFDTLAPAATLKILSVHSRRIEFEHLEATRFDLLAGFLSTLPADWHVKTLFDEKLVVMGGPALERLRGRLTVKKFLDLKHVVLAPDERTTHNMAELTLASMGLKRNIGTYVSNFSAVPFIVAKSDLIAVVPSTFATRFAKLPGIQVLPAPIDFPAFPISMAWHPRVHEETEHRWLRQLVVDATAAALREK